MSKKFAISLENEDIQQVPVLNTEISELENSDAVIHSAAELEEATDVHDSTSDLIGVAQTEMEQSGEINPSTAKVLDIATEHFCKRMGLRKKLVLSQEHFTSNSKEASLQTIKSLETFNNSLAKSIVVAEEGFVEDIKTSASMAFETKQKVDQRLNMLPEKGYASGVVFTDDTWAKYLPFKQGDITASDVVKALQDMIKDSKNVDIKETIKELTKGLRKLTDEVRGNWFYSNKRDIERIMDIGKVIDNAAQKLKDETVSLSGQVKTSRKFTSPTDAEAKKIKSLIQELLDSSGLDQVVRELDDKSTWLKIWSMFNTYFRFKTAIPNTLLSSGVGMLGTAGLLSAKAVQHGVSATIATNAAQASGAIDSNKIADALNAEDIVKARKMATSARQALVSLKTISTHRVKVASAATSYLEIASKQ